MAEVRSIARAALLAPKLPTELYSSINSELIELGSVDSQLGKIGSVGGVVDAEDELVKNELPLAEGTVGAPKNAAGIVATLQLGVD